MQTWKEPASAELPGQGVVPLLLDHSSGELQPVSENGSTARIYVCGVTPYDATHIGHAHTYLVYDILIRALRDAGVAVGYAQNITDVDDPLLERANATDVDWEDLAAEQISLYCDDMQFLGIIPPQHLVRVTEAIDDIAEAVQELILGGYAYRVPTPDATSGEDIYFDVGGCEAKTPVWTLGEVSGCSPEQMRKLFAERGGDPQRQGKRNPLDPLLWRAERQGEPAWQVAGLPAGRPGWHIECTVIAEQSLGKNFDVQGGGSDLIFPHHEMSAGHAAALTGVPMARIYSHAGMLAFEGKKMSKSLGNLVFVGDLRRQGIDASALRTVLLAQPYAADWEWTDARLRAAQSRLQVWRDAAAASRGTRADDATVPAQSVLDALRTLLANDLDTPKCLNVLDAWAAQPAEGELVAQTANTLLGIDLLPGDRD